MSILNEWEVDTIITGSRNVQDRESLMNEFKNEIWACVDHEQKVSSQGEESKFIRTSPESEEVARKYMIMSRFQLNKKIRHSKNEGLDPFQQTCMNLTKEFQKKNSECLSQPCNPATKYRSIDGCCNNLENQSQGMPTTTFQRLLPSEYADSVSLPRGGLTSSSLPSARAVSVAVHQTHEETNHKDSISQMIMQFGQFLNHEFMLTPNQNKKCCNQTVSGPDSEQPEELRFCFNIDISNDDFYLNKRSCFPFTRSDATCTESGQREQFNMVTAFIDGSAVYGSDSEKAEKLRTKTGGLLRTHYLGPTLPSNRQTGFVNQFPFPTSEKLIAGDVRATEQPGLAAIHSLFVLEHNRIANEFTEADPSLTDEEVYQTARSLVSAQIQNIAYTEFLPSVIGPDAMALYNLNLPTRGTTVYNSSVNPNIFNEVATFAFRFGHSLIPNFFEPAAQPQKTVNDICPLKDNFFQIEEFVVGKDFSGQAWQNLLLGISATQSPPMDAKLSDHMSNFLFCGSNCDLSQGFGQDLAALNIQRGRDHGLPGYVKYRELCGLTIPTNWEDKPADISQKNWDNMRDVYTNVNDIDAFTGSISEKSVTGGIVGPTIACILGTQFKNLKEGDRFFFSHPSNGSKNEKGLSTRLRTLVRNRKLSDILCNNIQGNESIRSIFNEIHLAVK